MLYALVYRKNGKIARARKPFGLRAGRGGHPARRRSAARENRTAERRSEFDAFPNFDDCDFVAVGVRDGGEQHLV